jgi:hypothetical protein
MTADPQVQMYELLLGRVERADARLERTITERQRTVMRAFGVRRAADVDPAEWAVAVSMGLVPPKTP